MPKVQIRYDILIQDAFRSVVRSILTDVSKDGLRGDHHYFIKVDCTRSDVSISDKLREKYPNEMTIVLQHQFWDLIVSEKKFEVTLVFNNVTEKLVIPFTAIKGFYDPSVNFSIEFDLRISGGNAKVEATEPNGVTRIGKKPPAKGATGNSKTESSPVKSTGNAIAKVEKPASKTGKPASKGKGKKSAETAKDKKVPKTSNVVSLDAYRKKTK